jgi:multidrug resistance efflux pump
MPAPTETTAAPSTNGALVDRVQQLRLSGQLGGAARAGRGSLLPWVLCAMMAVAWAGVGVRWYRAAEPAGGNNRPTAQTAPNGTPSPVGPQATPTGGGGSPAAAPGELLLQIKGTLTPFVQINLSPIDVAGEVIEVKFKEGDRVRSHQELAKIRDTRYKNDSTNAEAALLAATAQIERSRASQAATLSRQAKAEAALEASKTRITKAQATLTQANLDLERAKNPVTAQATRDEATAKQAIAESEVVAAKADLIAAEKELEAAKADVRAAGAAVTAAEAEKKGAEARKAETDRLLKNCTILAPIDGTILTKVVEKGSLVSPMSFNVASGICTMADLSQLEVEIDVPERQITKVKVGLACVVQADADPTRSYRGKVDRIMPIADDTKNVVKVRVRVYLPAGPPAEVPGSFLKPKMSVLTTIYNRPFEFDPKTDQPWGGTGQ